MRYAYGLIGVLASGAFLSSCREGTGPGLEGRWAAIGIELTVQAGTTELRLACAAPARLTQGLLPDSTGTIRFSTPIQPVWGASYRVGFLGRLVGDGLFATVTRTFDAGTPVVQTYTMLRDGDPEFDRIVCAQ